MSNFKEQLEDILSQLNPGGVFGVDIGAHSVKVCELAGSEKKPQIKKFACVPLGEAVIIEDEIQKLDEVQEAILKAIKKAGIKSKQVCLGISGPNTMTKRMAVPDGSDEEVEDHVTWESVQYIPFGADDSEIDYDLLGDNESGGKDAVVVAARTDLIEARQDLIESCKLKPKIMELSVIALVNAFETLAIKANPELDEGTILIDYGSQSTKIVVIRDGGPVFTKELNLGSSIVTEEIQRQMAVSHDEAEDLKWISKDTVLPQEILGIYQQVFTEHIQEIKKNLNFYIAAGTAEQVAHCFITGGGARVPLFAELLSANIGLEVNDFNPFECGLQLAKGSNFSAQEVAGIGAVSIGLAMRCFG